MPPGGLVLKRSGMEEGEARRAVNSSAISVTVTFFMVTGNRRVLESTHTSIEGQERNPTVVALHSGEL